MKMHMNALMRNTHGGMNDEDTYECMCEGHVHGDMTVEDAHECMIEGHEHVDTIYEDAYEYMIDGYEHECICMTKGYARECMTEEKGRACMTEELVAFRTYLQQKQPLCRSRSVPNLTYLATMKIN